MNINTQEEGVDGGGGGGERRQSCMAIFCKVQLIDPLSIRFTHYFHNNFKSKYIRVIIFMARFRTRTNECGNYIDDNTDNMLTAIPQQT